jgi:tight adherence protein B
MPQALPLIAALLAGLSVYLLITGLAEAPRRGQPRPSAAPPTPVAEMLRAAGIDGTPGEFALVSLGLGGLGALAGHAWLSLPASTLIGGAVGLGGVWLWAGRRGARRRTARRAAVIQAMLLTSQLVATRGTPRQALTYLAAEGPPALRAEFRRLLADLQIAPFEAAMRAAQARLADKVFDAFAVALVFNERYGSTNLAATLTQQARQALRMEGHRREAAAQYAANQASALVVIGALAVAGAAMMRLSPDYVGMYTTWWGQLLLAGYAGAFAIAYWLMMRIVRLPREKRVVEHHPPVGSTTDRSHG